ncbi:MAG: WGR domain-containing protein [Gammaproteobacteria bacterium]|nr:WGR domain-containing protein [Gammaproteobacteria bacterium]
MNIQTTLYFKQGGSDKVYQVEIKAVDGGLLVNFSYGKRGSALRSGTKTAAPVDNAKAIKLYNGLIKSKKTKGYTEGVNGVLYEATEKESLVSGINCQLLNPIDETTAMSLCLNDDYCAQSKHDGERRLIERTDDTVQGINRKGLYVALSSVLASSAKRLSSKDYIIDGEGMGDVLVAFDMLRYDGNDIRHLPYSERFELLKEMVSLSKYDSIRITRTAYTIEDKNQLFIHLETANHEGIVFKRLDSVWSAGRPNSGGDALKYKFYEECSVIVDKINDGKRSVSFYVNDGSTKVSIGNVTIPPNKDIPLPGEIIEVKYLYFFEGGSLYQPIYLKPRNDLHFFDCSITQLKYKNEAIAA